MCLTRCVWLTLRMLALVYAFGLCIARMVAGVSLGGIMPLWMRAGSSGQHWRCWLDPGDVRWMLGYQG